MEQDRRVAVTEETEIVGEGIVVYRVPVAAHKRAHQQKQGRFGLVEIRNQLIYDMERISRLNHYLCLGVQSVLSRTVQIVQYTLQRLLGGIGVMLRIGYKLPYMQLLQCTMHNAQCTMLNEYTTDKVQALKGAHTGGSHSNDMTCIRLNISD